MQYRPLGSSGIEASAVALGAWAIGGWRWGGQDEQESVAAIQAALDAGITLIDTAPVYGFGKSEEVVGRAIAGRRDEVVLASKCGLRWDDPRGELHFVADEHGMNAESGKYEVRKFLGPDSIRHEVEHSLRRLQTDRIDLMQTHWQDATTPIEDTMAALLSLKDEGKIRAIGASNATPSEMNEYRAVGPLDADQERYSMLDRELESEQLPYCREHNIAVLAYSPMANGLLTGKVTHDREFNQGDLRESGPRFAKENLERVQTFLAELRPIADGHGITLAQLTIAWTIAQPGLTHALVGARTPKQAQENAAAGDVTLTKADLAAVERALAKHSGAIK